MSASQINNFELFRYQILPIDRFLQGDLLNGIQTVEELLSRKNEFFAEALRQAKSFSTGKADTITKSLLDGDDFFLYRIAANRSIHRETKEFTDEYIDNWPSVLAAIWNEPDKQLIAVQRRTTAFQHTDTVANLIIGALSDSLAHHQLRVHVEPLFEVHEFWALVEKHKDRVQSLEFEFVTPNMANISGTLPDNLKEFAKQTNSATNKLEIESDPDSALKVDKDNETISGLVDYSAAGGGNIAVKIARMRKKYHTSKSKKQIQLDDVQLGGTAEEVASLLKELMR